MSNGAWGMAGAYGVAGMLALGITAGCQTSDTTGTGGNGGESAQQSSSSGMTTWEVDAQCQETKISEAALTGPGYDSMKGFTGTPQASYVVSATALYVPADKTAAFNQGFPPVLSQVTAAPGLVAFALGADSGCNVYRTLTVWDSQESMVKFITSGAHANVVPMVKSMSDAGKVTVWKATPEEVQALTWDVTRAELDKVDPIY